MGESALKRMDRSPHQLPFQGVAPSAAFPEPYPRCNAQGERYQGSGPHTAEYRAEQPTGWQQPCPPMWSAGVSHNLHRNGNS